MNSLTLFKEDIEQSEIFTRCFVSLENLSNNMFLNFRCTVLNQPREGMMNVRNCWQFDFYADNPFKAMQKGFEFVINNIKSEYKMNYDECLKLRHEINDFVS